MRLRKKLATDVISFTGFPTSTPALQRLQVRLCDRFVTLDEKSNVMLTLTPS